MSSPEEVTHVEEDSPAILKTSQHQEGAAAPAALQAPPPPALSLTLPPPPQQRQEEEEGAGEDSRSERSWEMLSQGQGSHCGSSPRSVGCPDAFDGAEPEGALPAAVSAAAPPPAAAGAVATPAVEEQRAAQTQPEGAQAEGEEPEGGGAAVQAVAGDSPRSAVSSAGSARHDLYSLSQDGSLDALSDSYTDDLMLAGEPDSLAEGQEGQQPGEEDGALSTPAPGAAASFCGTLSAELRALAARVQACLLGPQAAGKEAAGRLWHTVTSWVGALQARIAGLRVALPSGLGTTAELMRERAQVVVQHARKELAAGKMDWGKVAMAVSCAAMGVLLYRSYATNARLAARLAQREGELGELVSRIMQLQRNLTHRSVPIIRHTSCTMASPWPMLPGV